MKAILGLIVALAVIGGAGFGLKKMGKLPGMKPAAKAGAVNGTPNAGGGGKGGKPGALVAAAPAVPGANDPLASEKSILAAQRKALDDEKTAWQAQKNAASAKPAASAADPKSLARIAAVYETMAPEVVTRIFAKLPDDQVIALLRRMEEKRVGEVLAGVAPDRAVKLTQALSRPAPAPAE